MWIMTLSVLLWLGSVTLSHAQLAVIDAANLGHNSVTSFQSTVTAIESVLQSGYMVLELEPFGDTGLNGEFFTKLAELEAILAEGEHVIWDIESLLAQIRALYGLEGAPDNSTGLRERLYLIRRHKQSVFTYAQRVLTLQRTAIHTIRHIGSLLDRIVDFVGGKQARQNISAQLSVMTQLQNEQGVLTAAFQQSMLTELQEQPMVDEATQRINTQIYSTMPRP
jgi:hypothetical protein